jgi:CheY-like chemotaxis protein
MNRATIYSVTTKGIAELNSAGVSANPELVLNNIETAATLLPEDLKVLAMFDGKLSIEELTNSLSQKGRNSFFSALRKIEQMELIQAVGVKDKSDMQAISALKRANRDLPFIEVTELSGEESVQVWAEARRGARSLQENGFFASNQKAGASDNVTVRSSARNVLVVEDDDSISQLLQMLLTEKGFSVQIAADIPSALSSLNGDNQFDLVLLDIILPGLSGKNGFHVLEMIRTQRSSQNLPVVMVTSQVSDEQVLQGLKAGADGYIFKPLKWESLYQCIDNVIGK